MVISSKQNSNFHSVVYTRNYNLSKPEKAKFSQGINISFLKSHVNKVLKDYKVTQNYLPRFYIYQKYLALKDQISKKNTQLNECIDSLVDFLKSCNLDKTRIFKITNLIIGMSTYVDTKSMFFIIQTIGDSFRMIFNTVSDDGVIKGDLLKMFKSLEDNLKYLQKFWKQNSKNSYQIHALNKAFLHVVVNKKMQIVRMVEELFGSIIGVFERLNKATYQSKKFIDYLVIPKDKFGLIANYLKLPVFSQAIYLDFLKWKLLQSREKALANLSHSSAVPRELFLGNLNDTDQPQLIKEVDPELHALLKKITRYQSGSRLLTNMVLNLGEILNALIGLLCAGGMSLFLIAFRIFFDTSIVAKILYDHRCKFLQQEELMHWNSLENQVHLNLIDASQEDNKKNLVARFIFSLSEFKKKDQFKTKAVAAYLQASQNSQFTFDQKVKDMEKVLKKEDNANKYNSKERREIAIYLLTDVQRFLTKKIKNYLSDSKFKNITGSEKIERIKKLLVQKAIARRIKLDSKFAVLKLYQRLHGFYQQLQTNPGSLPASHPLRIIIGPFAPELFLEMDEEMGKEMMQQLLGQVYFS